MTPEAPADAFKQAFDDGEMKTIRLTKHTVPNDIADHLEISKAAQDLGRMIRVVQAPRTLGFNKKKNLKRPGGPATVRHIPCRRGGPSR